MNRLAYPDSQKKAAKKRPAKKPAPRPRRAPVAPAPAATTAPEPAPPARPAASPEPADPWTPARIAADKANFIATTAALVREMPVSKAGDFLRGLMIIADDPISLGPLYEVFRRISIGDGWLQRAAAGDDVSPYEDGPRG